MERIEPSNIRIHQAQQLADIVELPSAAEARAQTEASPTERRRTSTPPAKTNSGMALSLAGVFSVFWAGGLAAYLIGFLGLDGLQQISPPWWGLIGAVAIMPVALAWLAAYLLREARILHQQSVTLATAAASLLEPEDHAAKSLTRLGRTVRREVDVFNAALEAALSRMTMIEVSTNERLASLEKSATAAQERVDRAAQRLGAERDKLAQFSAALDGAVMSVSDTLTARLNEARAAARVASESLESEQGAIVGLIETLKTSAVTAASKASETAKEIERQAQRLDAASEAAAARSEQVVARHERQRAALAETIDRLKVENDHMARAVESQREGMGKLIMVLGEEAKRLDAFTVDGVRRLDQAAAIMAQRITETTSLFTREADKLRTSTEMTSSGLEQAVNSIRNLGDNSFEAAGKLGSVLTQLRETATAASLQVEGTIARLGKVLQELPAEAAIHTQHLRTMLDQQATTVSDLSSRVAQAFDKLQSLDNARQATAAAQQEPLTLRTPVQTAAPQQQTQPPQQTVPNFNVPPASQFNVAPASAHLPQRAGHHTPPDPTLEPRGWFGLAKKFVGINPADAPDLQMRADRTNGGAGGNGDWDIKSLLAAAEQRERGQQQRQQPQQQPQDGYHTSSRHMIETLQAMAIDLDRFLEDDPPLDLLRRYRNGERNIFARRLVSVLGRDQADRIGRKYREDSEFKDTVDRYVEQFETLMEETAGRDRENVLAETYLTSQTGKVYVMLASSIGRLG
ncbi:MAG: hypothetical protein GC190_05975 [Alphaproteobacteria bacterium]|nr:hypothetical protein [Alphaproteobacteria bacterium]